MMSNALASEKLKNHKIFLVHFFGKPLSKNSFLKVITRGVFKIQPIRTLSALDNVALVYFCYF